MRSEHERFGFTVPQQKQIRLIIDTDAKNEADDQFAIAHAVITQKFNIKGIIGAHFGEEKSNQSMMDSYEEIEKVLSLMEVAEPIPVLRGAEREIKTNETQPSEGSDIIIKEALKDERQPLFCIFLGPLTDMAIALLKEPKITNRLCCVWIGGGAWPKGGEEYNLHNDINAANIVFNSGVELWQIPRNVYSMMRVSLSELQVRVKPHGKIGAYLFSQLIQFNDQYAENKGWPLGESWVLGDSAAIGVLLDEQNFDYRIFNAPRISRSMNYLKNQQRSKVRVYNSIDARFVLEDFYSKLMLFSSRG